MVCVGRGIAIDRLVGVSVWCVFGLVSEGGRGGGGVGVALLVAGGAGVGVALVGSLGVPPSGLGVACACRTVLVVPGWLRCRGTGGRRPHGHLGGAVVRK